MGVVPTEDEIDGSEIKFFAAAAYSPIRARCHKGGGVTAATASALTLSLPVNDVFDRRVDHQLLQSGIAIETNGTHVGYLRQTSHGWRRKDRIYEVLSVEHGHFPEGTYFRFRGGGRPSLELPGGKRLVSHLMMRPRRLRVSDAATEEMVALFAAVSRGFKGPLAQTTPWKE